MGENISRSVSHFLFTDPFNVAIQTDKDQVAFFNKLSGTSEDTIRWSMKKDAQCSLDITEKNKEEIIPDVLSKVYCLLSVSLFENLVTLLKRLGSFEKSGSFEIINEFYDMFEDELSAIDQKKVDNKTSTILTMHNLRIFRNCITHTNSSIEEVEKRFNDYNSNLNDGKREYRKLKNLGELQRELFYYSADTNRKIFLSSKSFNDLLDCYSQLAYMAYLCYCNKFKHKVEIE